jgi:hypothetical protein
MSSFHRYRSVGRKRWITYVVSMQLFIAINMFVVCCGGTKEEMMVKGACPNFGWPPPKASQSQVLPDRMIGVRAGDDKLADVDAALTAALSATGYLQRSYFVIPEGFALVTQLEQINADGSPREAPDRWLKETPHLTRFSLQAYLRALFTAQAGHYRIIAFLTTTVPFVQSDATVKRDDAEAWLRAGCNRLPTEIGLRKIGSETAITALVYEFLQSDSGRAEQVDSSVDHLLRSGLTNALRNARQSASR